MGADHPGFGSLLFYHGDGIPCGPFDVYSIIEAEDYCRQSGINTESCSEGTRNVGHIDAGDWIVFSDVDFGKGVASVDARVASKTTGGTIEFRLGGPTGALIGSVKVGITGGWQDWTTVTTDISGARGTQDLYLVFTDGVFNLNWIEFEAVAKKN